MFYLSICSHKGEEDESNRMIAIRRETTAASTDEKETHLASTDEEEQKQQITDEEYRRRGDTT